MSIYDDIKKLHELLDMGAITLTEFEKEKQRILGTSNSDDASQINKELDESPDWPGVHNLSSSGKGDTEQQEKGSSIFKKLLTVLLIIVMPYVGFFMLLIYKPFSKKVNNIAAIYCLAMSLLVFSVMFSSKNRDKANEVNNSAGNTEVTETTDNVAEEQNKANDAEKEQPQKDQTPIEIPLIFDLSDYYSPETGSIWEADFQALHNDAIGPDYWNYKDQSREFQVTSYFLYKGKVEYEFKFVSGILSRITVNNINKQIADRNRILETIGVFDDHSDNVYIDHFGAFKAKNSPMLDFWAIMNDKTLKTLNITFDNQFPL